MPAVRVVWYRDGENCPLRRWLDSLAPRSRFKCLAHLTRLETFGHALRRPLAAHLGLGDDIHELRIRDGRLQLRLLYFFHGVGLAVISHGFIKKTGTVSQREVTLAHRRRQACRANLAAHLFDPER